MAAPTSVFELMDQVSAGPDGEPGGFEQVVLCNRRPSGLRAVIASHSTVLGPALGADYPRLHALVAQVPEDARAPLLDALRGLDAQARDDLAVLAARIPPQARADLRVELLATPPDERSRWLRSRVSQPLTLD